MQTLNLRRALLTTGLVSLALVYVVLWLGMIGDPRERTGADFIAFYAAGRIARTEGAARVYDVGLQQDVQEGQVGFPLAPGQVLLYNHLPYLIPLLHLVVNESYVASFGGWTLVLIVLYLGGIAVLSRPLLHAGYESHPTLLAGAGSLLFFPVFVSLMNGQDTAFMFLGAAVWMAGLLGGRDALAGLGLSLTTVRPHIAVALALPFLFRRRKVLAWFVIGAGILGLCSVLILGSEGTRGFINLLLVSAGGEWYGMKEPEMFNLIGLLFRLAPGLGADAIHAISWGFYALTIIAMCILWLRSPSLTEGQVGTAVAVTLFAVPHLHFHDLALLLLPVYGLLLINKKEVLIGPNDAALLPLAASILLIVSNFTPLLKYTVPYLMTAFLIMALWFPHRVGAIFRRPS
jgi:hypothetical protein